MSQRSLDRKRMAKVFDLELEQSERLEVAKELLASEPVDLDRLEFLGQACPGLVDIDDLNRPSPDDAFFAETARRLLERLDTASSDTERIKAASGLIAAARIAGRAWDSSSEHAHRVLIELKGRWQDHYDLGLFLKTRGRFAEGAAANRRAAELGGADDESVIWNHGICSTGAGDGATALELWRGIGCRLELGGDGLPVGGFAAVQVKLAERPLAERGPELDDPGLEETIWIERLSPCHGMVISALYQDLGVDFGDLVLFDGAPIVSRRWDGRDEPVPVFPHLATLRREPWHRLAFAATQNEAGQVGALTDRLPEGAQLYVHTEAFRILCQSCWRQDQSHDHDPATHQVVTGKLVVPPKLDLAELATQLDGAIAGAVPEIFVPELWRLLGDPARAEREQRQFDLLEAAEPTSP